MQKKNVLICTLNYIIYKTEQYNKTQQNFLLQLISKSALQNNNNILKSVAFYTLIISYKEVRKAVLFTIRIIKNKIFKKNLTNGVKEYTKN